MIGEALMGKVDLPYLTSWLDRHGKRRYFVRRHGKKTPIKGTPGTAEFQRAYEAALGISKSTTADPKSLRWLCERYMASAEYRQLNERTRHVRKLLLDRICAKAGEHPYKALRSTNIRQWRDARADRPGAANDLVKALRQIYKWAMDVGHADANPATGVPYLLPSNPDGFHTWTVAEVEQFRASHPLGTKPRLALELLLYTGTRRSDVVKLGRQMERDGWLEWTETKGRTRKVKTAAIPILAPLRQAIDATPSGHMTYLVTERGHPYSPEGFGNWFRRQCRAAGLPHCSPHGLRKAGATIAAEQGATEHELMAIFGWETSKQAGVYTRKASKRRLAGAGMGKLISKSEVG